MERLDVRALGAILRTDETVGAAGAHRQPHRNDEAAGAQVVVSRKVVRQQGAGAFAGGIELHAIGAAC